MAEPMNLYFEGVGHLPHYPVLGQHIGRMAQAFDDQTEPLVEVSVLIDGPTPLAGVYWMNAHQIALLCADLHRCLRHAEMDWRDVKNFR